MEKFLVGKKILFITTKYFGYEKAIAKGLKAYGADIKVFYDDPINYTGIKNMKDWIGRPLVRNVNFFYRRLILRKTAKIRLDYILILKGSIMSDWFMKTLHERYPQAVFIQYQWDSLHNYNYERYIKYFNVNLTFDPADANRIPALQYLPTFALDEFFKKSKQAQNEKRKIDISFVGSNHSDRLKTLRKLRQRLSKLNFRHKFYVYLPLIVSVKSVVISRKMKPEEFMLTPLSRKKYKSLLLKSRFVLDLPSPTQTGIPLRIYEALASGCRVITTNEHIVEEPFFNDKHVFIVSRTGLEETIPILLKQDTVTEAFLSYDDYSLSSWLKKLFAFTTSENFPKAPFRN